MGHSAFECKEVPIMTPEGTTEDCKVILRNDAPQEGALPSPQYKEVILKGAVEAGLPDSYIKLLSNQSDNGYQGHLDFRKIDDNWH